LEKLSKKKSKNLAKFILKKKIYQAFEKKDILSIVFLLKIKNDCFNFYDKGENGKLVWEYIIDSSLTELVDYKPYFLKKYYKAKINTCSLDWEKALRMAANNKQYEDVRFLIEFKKINVNAVDTNPKYHRTPLHWAAITKETAIYNYLISKNADVDLKDANQKKPSDYRLIKNDEELEEVAPTTNFTI